MIGPGPETLVKESNMRYALALLLVAMVGLTGCHKKNKDITMAVNEPPSQSLDELSAVPAPEPAPAAVVPPAPYPAAPAYQAPAPTGERTYVVQSKDTLWGIATRELGNGRRWHDIADINPGLTPQNLKAGQTIKLPPR